MATAKGTPGRRCRRVAQDDAVEPQCRARTRELGLPAGDAADLEHPLGAWSNDGPRDADEGTTRPRRRVYTDPATFDLGPDGVVVRDRHGMAHEELAELLAPLELRGA